MAYQPDYRKLPRKADTDLGKIIQDARERMSMTQNDLAKAVARIPQMENLQSSMISKIETGKVKQPDNKYLIGIAEVLNIPPLYLLAVSAGLSAASLSDMPEWPNDIVAFASWLQQFDESERAKIRNVAEQFASAIRPDIGGREQLPRSGRPRTADAGRQERTG